MNESWLVGHTNSAPGTHNAPWGMRWFGGILVFEQPRQDTSEYLEAWLSALEYICRKTDARIVSVYSEPSLINQRHIEKRLVVAKKSNTNTDGNKGLGAWNGITEIPVTAADYPKFETWVAKANIAELLTELVLGDNKVTLTYNDRQNCHMATISCYDATSPNYKFSMITRAGDPIQALQTALWKHFELADEDWKGTATDRPVWG